MVCVPTRSRKLRVSGRLTMLSVLLATPPLGFAAETAPPTTTTGEETYSASLALDDLLKVKITSVSGIASSWFGSPAAITVISGDDLRRQGFQSLPEALRAVPGMEVARLTSHDWAVSARGFNHQYANKLLVLIDGRQVYNAQFAGVLWDGQDVLLDDVDRIEVIRGPGATLWGANAVNGVINITTRRAKNTQGFYATAGGGTEERAFGGARYGGRIGDKTYFRVWGKHVDRDAFVDTATGDRGPDDWNMSRAGGRLEIEASAHTTVTVDGEVYGSDRLGANTRLPVPGHLTFGARREDYEANGEHLLFRLEDGSGQTSGGSVQAYYDRDNRKMHAGAEPRTTTWDLDVRRHFNLGSRNVILVGVGWRHLDDAVGAGEIYAYRPEQRKRTTYSGFVQDTISLGGHLSLMAGSKFEDNDDTGFEAQPSARLAFTPSDRHTVWAAVSRPVRTPGRADQDVDLLFGYVDAGLIRGGPPIGFFIPIKVMGSPDVTSERLTAYELGFRTRVGSKLSFDVAAYENRYRDLISRHAVTGTFGNFGTGRGRGVELAVALRPHERLRVDAAYAYSELEVEERDFGTSSRRATPHQANLRLQADVTSRLEVNGGLYYVAKQTDVPSSERYVRADLGLSFRPLEKLQLAVWGQNLLQDRQEEFEASVFQARGISVQRGVYAQLTVRN